MSKISLTPNASGTGTFTIASPNSNTNRTVNLPDAGGDMVLTTATQTLTNKDIVATQLTGTIAAARLPAGSVLQVVQATYSTELLTTSTSYVDTNLSASITPTSASSKILVLVNQQVSLSRDTNETIRVDCQIVRTSTSVYTQGRILGGRAGTSAAGDIYYVGSFNGTYLDSPNTTSSTTYKTQGRVSTSSNSGTAFFQESGQNSTITLVEIAA
jgi:hypothetical protein